MSAGCDCGTCRRRVSLSISAGRAELARDRVSNAIASRAALPIPDVRDLAIAAIAAALHNGEAVAGNHRYRLAAEGEILTNGGFETEASSRGIYAAFASHPFKRYDVLYDNDILRVAERIDYGLSYYERREVLGLPEPAKTLVS